MDEDQLIQHAEVVVEHAADMGVDLLVIGAVALAGHQYVRLTRDIDLAGNLTLSQFSTLASRLEEAGYEVTFREPDAEDPLAGVLDINGTFGLIQVISFEDRLPALIGDAAATATLRIRADSSLRIIPLEFLVALKLYAGGFKSKADIVEVLSRNPDADLDVIQGLCDKYLLSGFEEVRREISG